MKIASCRTAATAPWALLTLVMALAGGAATAAAAAPPFAFEAVTTLDEMASLIRARLPLGSASATVRRTFVEEGHASLKTRAGAPGIEKYLYDIDLCHYYVWRWNISADYDEQGRLLQAYVNGNIVFPNGAPKVIISKVAEAGKKAAIYRAQRPRPEAYKGEKSLGFLLFDRDGDLASTDDQALMGAGPSRADPANMGTMVVYSEVDPWRSIFDADPAGRIHPYAGRCDDADRLHDAQRQAPRP
ncbi:hypothetical protein [Massilia sp. DWR3-1-1]|uniref:hypothetical protein n=1 Tax=Massilia sp. DWR3-1-1 TaxID=2804559 RepID=UPI003CEFDB8A